MNTRINFKYRVSPTASMNHGAQIIEPLNYKYVHVQHCFRMQANKNDQPHDAQKLVTNAPKEDFSMKAMCA